jgi:hypothetical protein
MNKKFTTVVYKLKAKISRKGRRNRSKKTQQHSSAAISIFNLS